METTAPLSLGSRFKNILSRRSFWILGAMLVGLGLMHYLTPQVRFLPLATSALGRHAVERIIFILPVAGATFAFGQTGGLFVLGLAILVMLPRALFISPYPADASIEIVAVGVVGYLVIWMIETQEREKRLRQEAVARLKATNLENVRLHQEAARQLRIEQQLNEIAEEITSELELDRVLPKVLQIAEEMVGADGGVIALFDQEGDLIHYPYIHNLPEELRGVTVPREQGLSGEVVTTGRSTVIENYQTYPNAIPVFAEAGVTSVVAVPLVSSDQSFGALALFSLETKSFSERDIAILTGIGRQAGIAIENAHLYENMRFYARQITRVQEDERKRIARELHDETTQMLIVMSRHLEVLATLPEPLPETAMRHLESLQGLTGDTLRGVRRFIQDLRPSTLDHLGLVATLEGLTNDLKEKDGINTELKVTGKARRLMPEEELMLFRLAQGSLSNVRRHAMASRVTVEVEFHPGKIRMIIEDDGRGFNPPDRISDLVSTGRLGLVGMHERARLLGGTLAIQSEPGQGTVVIVDVPVQPGSLESKEEGTLTP